MSNILKRNDIKKSEVRAILDLLLDNHKLIFEREELIEEEVLRCRSGKEFEKRYLRKGFTDKITIYRVLDSRSERFILSKAYEAFQK